jgi:acetyl-CoA acetyltransferase
LSSDSRATFNKEDFTMTTSHSIDDPQALRGAVAVVGVGNTRYGKLPEYNPMDLGGWALRNALDDCGLTFSDIDGLIVNRIDNYQRFGEMCGIDPRYTLPTPGHGRLSGVCIQTAAALIASGVVRNVALVYANNGSTAGATYGADAYGSIDEHGAPYGMTSPGAYHALMMQRHMHLYGTTEDHLGAVAMTFRQHAALNPNAVMKKPFTLEEYRAARPICEPLRLLDYCLINDGAVAIIMTSAERAADLKKKPIYIRGVSQAGKFKDASFPPDDFWREPMGKVADDVYRMAGAKPDDMDGLMIYDNFSPVVLFTLEGFGFCAPGESGPWVTEGHLKLGGRFPSNTSGGHLSESYMQGWALNVEAVRQLRGECGARQISNPRLIQYMAAAPMVTSIIYGTDRQ